MDNEQFMDDLTITDDDFQQWYQRAMLFDIWIRHCSDCRMFVTDWQDTSQCTTSIYMCTTRKLPHSRHCCNPIGITSTQTYSNYIQGHSGLISFPRWSRCSKTHDCFSMFWYSTAWRDRWPMVTVSVTAEARQRSRPGQGNEPDDGSHGW